MTIMKSLLRGARTLTAYIERHVGPDEPGDSAESTMSRIVERANARTVLDQHTPTTFPEQALFADVPFIYMAGHTHAPTDDGSEEIVLRGVVMNERLLKLVTERSGKGLRVGFDDASYWPEAVVLDQKGADLLFRSKADAKKEPEVMDQLSADMKRAGDAIKTIKDGVKITNMPKGGSDPVAASPADATPQEAPSSLLPTVNAGTFAGIHFNYVEGPLLSKDDAFLELVVHEITRDLVSAFLQETEDLLKLHDGRSMNARAVEWRWCGQSKSLRTLVKFQVFKASQPASPPPAPPTESPKTTWVPDPLPFLESTGLLFEINRLVMHPRGLAMALAQDDSGAVRFAGICDARTDPEGIYFCTDALADGARKLAKADADTGAVGRQQSRLAALGFVVQPTVHHEVPTAPVLSGKDLLVRLSQDQRRALESRLNALGRLDQALDPIVAESLAFVLLSIRSVRGRDKPLVLTPVEATLVARLALDHAMAWIVTNKSSSSGSSTVFGDVSGQNLLQSIADQLSVFR